MIQTLPNAAQAQTIAAVESANPTPSSAFSLWGLSTAQVHDGYWRSKGVQVVRRGQRQQLQRAAELYLLLEPEQLALFDIVRISERLMWHNAAVTRLRLIDANENDYSERVIVDAAGLVQRIERRYRAQVRGSSRVMLTRARRVASAWMGARSRRDGWDRVRRSVPWSRVDHWKTHGRTFLVGNAQHEREMIDDLVERWPHPNQVINGLQETSPGVWHAGGETTAATNVRIGPLWLGQGAGGAEQRCLVGPTWLPDRPTASKSGRVVTLKDIADVELPELSVDVSQEPTIDIAPPPATYRAAKRAFDIFCSATALLALLPVMAVVGAAVWVESGWPLFFGHQRQGRNGQVFKCWKFRTMRRDAQKLARMLADQNQCDGPQVNIKNDPRVTRVGRILRRFNLDELPQFWNVFIGDMSLVGPRPSPDDENQYCPAWRDLRLSVRPGITGLWQLKRTREPGEDFQEWIKYDIEYVQKASIGFDLMILFRTAILVLRGRASSAAE